MFINGYHQLSMNHPFGTGEVSSLGIRVSVCVLCMHGW